MSKPTGGRINPNPPNVGRKDAHPPYYVARRLLTEPFSVFDSRHLWPSARPICSTNDYAEAQMWARKANAKEPLIIDPAGKRLYILPYKGHTHLCYKAEHVQAFCGIELAAKMNCSPRIVVPITEEMLARRDRLYSDVDCPLCLEAAR